MKLLAVLAVFVGIPMLIVSVHSSNRSYELAQAPALAYIPSYEKENIEKCFFWVPDEEWSQKDKGTK